jgi:cytochrome b561
LARRGEAGPGWGRLAIALHWGTALLVAGGFLLGWGMAAVPFRYLIAKFVLFQVHKNVGLLVLLMTVARLVGRIRRGRPAWAPGLAVWEIAAARGGHAMLYGLLLAVPLAGLLTADSAMVRIPTLVLGVAKLPAVIGPDAAWFAVLRWVHQGLAMLLVMLAAGHGAMAIRHHRRGLGVLRGMWPGRL